MKENRFSILIVEDDLPQREALTDKLSREGYQISQAKNGKEGLKKSLSEHPSLILLDIVMPEMDGYTMLKKLRKDEWGRTAPVIILTNLSSPETAGGLVDGRTEGFLVKADWTLEDLVKRIREVIKS